MHTHQIIQEKNVMSDPIDIFVTNPMIIFEVAQSLHIE